MPIFWTYATVWCQKMFKIGNQHGSEVCGIKFGLGPDKLIKVRKSYSFQESQTCNCFAQQATLVSVTLSCAQCSQRMMVV